MLIHPALIYADKNLGLKTQVIGTWEFTKNTESVSASLFDLKTVCTHELPNRVQVIPNGHQFELVGGTLESHLIELDVDNKAYVL